VFGGLAGASAASGTSARSARSGRRSGSAVAIQAGSDHHGGFTKHFLRKLMSRYADCLMLLPTSEARVLVLRTGLGIDRTYTRRQAARYLGVSMAREGRLERRAVVAVLRGAKSGSCLRAERESQEALFLAPGELSLLEQPLPRAFISASAPRRHSVKAAHSNRTKSPSVSGASPPPPGSIPNLAHSSSSSIPWLLIALAVLAATALVSPVARKRALRARTVGATVGGGRAARRAGAAEAAPAAPAAEAAAPAAPAPDAAAPAAPAPDAAAPAAPASDAAAALGAGALAAGAGAVAAERGHAAAQQDRAPVEEDPAAASRLGARLERDGDLDGAMAAYRQADAGGDAAAATNLGVLLERRGDLGGAFAAYRRADERGDANGSFNLGCLLADQGDLAGANEAISRADQRGDAAGASNLGVLLEQQGDLDGALDAYRRADERGDANGSFNLGLLLAGRGDLTGAQDAYRRATERGDPEVAERANAALAELRGNGDR
jgi:tetratricopeptide (TPR) repeat protein